MMVDLFQLENGEENYYKPIKNGSFYSKKYIEHESSGDRNITLSIEEYL